MKNQVQLHPSMITYANTKKQISRLGLGCWQLGSSGTWGEMSMSDGEKLVLHAYQKGVRLFDTAPNYSNTRSEQILGKALSSVREQVVLNTKVGHRLDGSTSFEIHDLEQSLKGSLERLQTNYIDSVILHNPPMHLIESTSSVMECLRAWKRKGIIRAFGVSVDRPDEVQKALQINDLGVIEVLYNLFFQGPREQLKEAAKKGITILAKVPLDSGWLSGKYNELSVFQGVRSRFDEPVIQRRSNLLKEVKAIQPNQAILSTAIGFLLSYDWIHAMIPGARTTTQIDELWEASCSVLDEQTQKQYEQFYDQHLRENPLPW